MAQVTGQARVQRRTGGGGTPAWLNAQQAGQYNPNTPKPSKKPLSPNQGPQVNMWGSGPVGYNDPQQPAWFQKIRNKLNQLGAPTSLSGSMVPDFNTQASLALGQRKNRQQHSPRPTINTPSPWLQYTLPATNFLFNQQGNLPAWLRTPGFQPTQTRDPYANPASQGGNPDAIPTGTFLGGGGDYVQGPNGLGYPIDDKSMLTSTFLGGGGSVAQGPQFYFPQTPAMQDQAYSGFGSRYSGWGRGWGGGGGGGYGNYSNVPAWFLGLNSWNFGE